MNTNNQKGLRSGWTNAKVEDICIKLVGGGTPSREKNEYFDGDIIWLTPTEIPKNKIMEIKNSKEKITRLGLEASSATIIPSGTVLLTSRATIGAVAIAGCEVSTNQGFASFICSKAVNNRYLAYWLWGNKDLLESKAKGTTFKEISKSILRELILPLPPLNEQKRIVFKLEELITKLDAGVEYLKKTQILLNRYRQSVLKYAFEGKLTERWRMGNIGKMESSELNSNNTIEFHDKVSQEKLRQIAKESYPKEWLLSKLKDACKLITKGESPNWQGYEYLADGIAFIRSENVLFGKLDIQKVVKIPEEFHMKLKRSQLKPNDVLINLVGASIGRSATVPDFIENANINQAVALIRVQENVNPKYLMYLLISPKMQKRIHQSKVETARPNVSLTDIRELVIPIPKIVEQNQLVFLVENTISIINNIEANLRGYLVKARSLRIAILMDAFEGKLVSQDSNDESAEFLLERIRKERGTVETIIRKEQNDINQKRVM
ncbi:MAG: restriction endonuclease subunit S [Nitrososphaeraceae archaeon]